MYINDTHILIYLLIGILGLVVGQFVDWCNKCLPEEERVISKKFFTQYLKGFKPNYVLMLANAIAYIALVYTFGVSIELGKYLLLVPMLLSAFCIDLKLQIIPNRLNLSIFEVGIIFTVIQVLSNINLGITTFTNNLLGMLAGGGIFLLITLIGGAIAGKEAMGFGDVKLMGALGLFFGWLNIIIVSVLAFLLAAVISIGILIFRKKKVNEYIPFGPFIVASCLVVIFTPYQLLLTITLKIFTLGMYQG